MRAVDSMRRPSTSGEAWAVQTRRVLTRDLLLRAARAQPAEKHSLMFRALHLNLPLVGEAAEGLGLTAVQRSETEHCALDALAQALRSHDPYGEEDFVDHATPIVERAMVARLPGLSPRTGRASRR